MQQGSTPSRAGRGRAGAAAWIGVIILGAVTLLCAASLPWTLGKVHLSRAVSVARFEASNPQAALEPPWWWADAESAPKPDEDNLYLPGRFLGTDRMGRDFLARCLAGGAISLIIGFAAAAVSVVIGTVYGLVAGFAGGRVDAALMRIVDILFSLPSILLVVLLAVAVEGVMDRPGEAENQTLTQFVNLLVLLVAIGGVSWLTMARVVRGQVLSLRELPFMEACRALGVPWSRQVTRHLLPNLVGPIVVYAALAVPAAILSESFLSFLGIGVRPPLPSWGNLASDGLAELNLVRSRWWLLLFPCVLIAVTLLSLNFLGDFLRERFDPMRSRR